MKIGIFGIDSLPEGKANLTDNRVETLKQLVNSPKKVYIQVEIISNKEKLSETDGILALESAKVDLILNDLEFVESRLERSSDDLEKNLFTRFRDQLNKEEFLFGMTLSQEEKKLISGYPLVSIKPIYLAKPQELENKDELIFSAYHHFGYISFFTANEKEAHAWSIKKGTSAWEAAGCVHSDIQKGFIRAEVASLQDLINDGGLAKARANNHVRLETKDYIVQDGDYILFRCNK